MAGAASATEGTVLPYTAPDAEQKKTAYLGMTVFIAGWTMMFGVMFFIYGALRISAKAWPPLGLPLLPVALPTVNTVIMVASSFLFEWGLKEIRSGRPGRLAPAILGTAALGCLFCGLQWIMGVGLFEIGLTFDRGAYAAVFYGFAILHAGHVLIGIAALLYLAVRSFLGAYTTPRHLTPRMWAIYWHFVGILWIAIYALIIVL